MFLFNPSTYHLSLKFNFPDGTQQYCTGPSAHTEVKGNSLWETVCFVLYMQILQYNAYCFSVVK
jgi:hypothetical protein